MNDRYFVVTYTWGVNLMSMAGAYLVNQLGYFFQNGTVVHIVCHQHLLECWQSRLLPSPSPHDALQAGCGWLRPLQLQEATDILKAIRVGRQIIMGMHDRKNVCPSR